ncbi:MAG: glycoside hydrolase family 88 protein [Bacteroidales bacterium]|nr:glycoside hydrolase family 88 protein [Bacteroidales bacterium]
MKGLFIPVLILLFFEIGCQSSGESSKESDMNMPFAQKMANSVMTRYDSLVNFTQSSGTIKWQYDVAMLGQAVDKLGFLNDKYSEYLKTYVDYFIEPDGTVKKYNLEEYNLDYINPAKNLITLYKRTGEEKYNLAIQHFIFQLENQPTTHSGGFWHKKRYPWQMWLDGIYMASPFMVQYAQEFNAPEWFDEAIFQITHIYEKTVDEKTGLMYHAWDESRTQAWCDSLTGRSKHFWGRAMGWYTMALVDVLDYLPEKHPQREEIIKILNNVSEALLKVRDKETGLWYQVLDYGGREGNYLEASCSNMFTYVFAKGAKNGYLPAKFNNIASDSFDAILKEFIVKEPDGLLTMTHVCGGCGLGGNPYRDGSYEYYITEKQVDNDPKGVAPFILAAIELKR